MVDTVFLQILALLLDANIHAQIQATEFNAFVDLVIKLTLIRRHVEVRSSMHFIIYNNLP